MIAREVCKPDVVEGDRFGCGVVDFHELIDARGANEFVQKKGARETGAAAAAAVRSALSIWIRFCDQLAAHPLGADQFA